MTAAYRKPRSEPLPFSLLKPTIACALHAGALTARRALHPLWCGSCSNTGHCPEMSRDANGYNSPPRLKGTANVAGTAKAGLAPPHERSCALRRTVPNPHDEGRSNGAARSMPSRARRMPQHSPPSWPTRGFFRCRVLQPRETDPGDSIKSLGPGSCDRDGELGPFVTINLSARMRRGEGAICST